MRRRYLSTAARAFHARRAGQEMLHTRSQDEIFPRYLRALEEIDGLLPRMVGQEEARYVVALRFFDLPEPSRARLAEVIHWHIGPFLLTSQVDQHSSRPGRKAR